MVKELDSSSLGSFESDWNSSLECTNSTVSPNIVLQQNDPEEAAPIFGNICVTNGTDIHFGNKTFYQGPVTIKQFVYANGDKKRVEKVTESEVSPSAIKKLDLCGTGIDNPAYEETVIKRREISEIETDDAKTTRVKVEENEVLQGIQLKRMLKQCRISLLLTSIFIILISLSLATFILKHKNVSNETFTLEHSSHKVDEEDNRTPIKAPTDPITSFKPSKLKIVSRLEWLAQPPTHPTDPLITPVPFVIISHTATENCSSQAQCVFQVRFIQTFHLESRGWWDIGYNFLVGGDGEVYFGRGWDKEGAHTYGYNKKSIGIAFIGTFISTKPPSYQLIACKKLIALGVELGYIDKDYKLLGARQLFTTKSPGDALYEEIQTWPHWSKNF